MSIRDLLLGLCEKLCINLAAIDLFLVGGEKVQHKRMLGCLTDLSFGIQSFFSKLQKIGPGCITKAAKFSEH